MFKLPWLIFHLIMQEASPFEQTLITHIQGLRVKYLRVLQSSFGEDFQMFALICYMFKLSFYNYFTDNVGGATI